MKTALKSSRRFSRDEGKTVVKSSDRTRIGHGPQLVTETKLMQQYRVGSAVHAGGQVASVRNRAGDVEIFTIGTDGRIWNFYPDQTSETGYRSVQLDIAAQCVAADIDDNGHVVVFGSSGLTLYYATETGMRGDGRWGPTKTATLPLPPSPLAIAGIMTKVIDGKLYAGVLTSCKSAVGKTFRLSYCCTWRDNPGIFNLAKFTTSSLNCVWSGTSASTAQFTALDISYVGYDIAGGKVSHYPIAATFSSRSVATAIDAAGNNQYFAVLDDGNIYRLLKNSLGQYSWAQITQASAFLDIGAVTDAEGAIHLFSRGSDARLYDIAPTATGGWSGAAPIRTNIASATLTLNDAGNIELFLVGTSQATLFHLVREATTSNWAETTVEVPTNGRLEEYKAYSTDLTAYDEQGSPLPNTPVQVWASSETRIQVNGASFFIDAHMPANITTNAAGRLTVTQETSSLAASALQFGLTGYMPPGQSLGVKQFAGVQERLEKLDGTKMLDAETAEGKYVLGPDYRDPATADALAKACNRCMTLAGSTPITLATKNLSARARKLGVGHFQHHDAANMNRIVAPREGMHWQIDFSSGKPVFRDLDAEGAAILLAGKRAELDNVAGIFDFIEDIGDFISGVAEDIVSIVDTVITTVGDAVKAAITFVMDGVTYLFETVVAFVEQAFDLVEAIFAKVKVFFETLFEWLGFLFQWKDILRTRTALAYTVDQYLGFLEGAAAGIQNFIDAGFASAQDEVDALFDKLVGMVGATSSIGGYPDEKTPPEPVYESGAANNVVLNGALDNAGVAKVSMSYRLSGSATGSGDPWGTIAASIQALASTVSSSPAFAEAADYMTNLGGSLDNIFSQLLSALLRVVQGVIKAVLSGVQTVIDSVLQICGSIVSGLRDLLQSEWDIPLVSDLYEWLTGGKLTLLDLFCLIMAVPATVIYKVVKGAAPFPDDTSVSAFEATFSSETILARSGFAPAKSASQQVAYLEPNSDGDNSGALLLAIASALCSFAYGIFSAVLDVKPMTGAGKPDPATKTISKIALGCEIAAQAFGCPWISSSGPPDCSTADGAGKTLWIFECFGVLLDSGFVYYEEAFPENNDTVWGIVAAQLYGAGHIIAVAIVGSNLSGLNLASKICTLIPENTKFLRLPQIEAGTEGISLPVIAAIDFFGIVSSGVLAFADTVKSSETIEGTWQLAIIPGAVPLAD